MDRSPVVLVNPPALCAAEPAVLGRLEERGARLVRNLTGATLDRAELALRLADADFAIAGLERYSAEVLSGAPRLRAIARFGVGTDTIDRDAAASRGIAVAVAAGANTESVADFTLALMSATACALVDHHKEVAGGGWRKRHYRGLNGATLGIVGYGKIGRAVRRRAEGFGMQVITRDPLYCDLPSAVSFDDLLRRSDVVTLHLPPIGGPIIGAAELAAMKPGAILVNTARGELVDEAALAEALTSGRLAGAALDVFGHEPLGDSPLREAPNVLFSPHVAAIGGDAIESTAAMCVDTIIAHIDGARD